MTSFILALVASVAAQEPVDTSTKDFVIRVETRENPTFKALWVSRDGGRNWHPAEKVKVEAVWGAWSNGMIRCAVRVPEEGIFDFYAQLGDAVGNRGPEPQSGQPASPRMRIEVREQAGLGWDEPQGLVEWTGGAAVTLRWHGRSAEIRERSAELQYSMDGEPWTAITKGLDGSGNYPWVVPNRESTHLRLRLMALMKNGRPVEATSGAVSVRVVTRPNVVQARSLYDRARVLQAQGRLPEAILKYEEALGAWSEFGEAHNDLGTLYAQQKEPAKALEYFLRARKACPSNPVAYVNAARMQMRIGLLDDAMADLRDAVALGVEGDERTSVLAGDTLWKIAVLSEKSPQRLTEACRLILSIRQAARPDRARAEHILAAGTK